MLATLIVNVLYCSTLLYFYNLWISQLAVEVSHSLVLASVEYFFNTRQSSQVLEMWWRFYGNSIAPPPKHQQFDDVTVCADRLIT